MGLLQNSGFARAGYTTGNSGGRATGKQRCQLPKFSCVGSSRPTQDVAEG